MSSLILVEACTTWPTMPPVAWMIAADDQRDGGLLGWAHLELLEDR